MMTATLTLLLRKIPVPAQKMVNGLPLRQRVGVENYPHGGVSGLVADARVAATRDLLVRHGGPVRDPGEFAELLTKIRPEVPGLVRQTIVELAPALVEFVALRQELANWTGEAITDMQAQLHEYMGEEYHPEEWIRPEQIAAAVRLAVDATRDAEVEVITVRPSGMTGR